MILSSSESAQIIYLILNNKSALHLLFPHFTLHLLISQICGFFFFFSPQLPGLWLLFGALLPDVEVPVVILQGCQWDAC